jgi:uncharacterized heparinase superfamily protein
MKNLWRLWRTVRHLTGQQILYQVWHRLRGPARLHLTQKTPEAYFLAVPDADKPLSWQPGQFAFLNLTVHFPSAIDWNYAHHGKLWTYNLNYFDFLNQPDMPVDRGLILIRDFIHKSADVRDGLEVYPTSLRIINWVQFVSRHQIRDGAINQHLFAQVRLLRHRLEYHLAGNHLLENGFALLTGALYFRYTPWIRKATDLLYQELDEQILPDGGHYERSSTYHQLLLDRLLDTLLILQSPTGYDNTELNMLLTQKGTSMLNWLNAITFQNGDVPMVNDTAPDIAPNPRLLQKKASQLLPEKGRQPVPLDTSGYRMFRQNRYELFTSVGSIGPAHQPGHAHADTFSFVLTVDNLPILVDNGTSTYQNSPRRDWERSTAAHNTVTVANTNSSEMWASFRVGRRARVTMLTDTSTKLTARHDGYRHWGVIHERTWSIIATSISITDQLLPWPAGTASTQPGTARFYFHPSVSWQLLDDGVRAGPLSITFRSATKPAWRIEAYEMANGFNRFLPGHCLVVYFITRLETILTLIE